MFSSVFDTDVSIFRCIQQHLLANTQIQVDVSFFFGIHTYSVGYSIEYFSSFAFI